MSWLYWLGVYLGVAIIFSLCVPMRTGRSFDTLKDISPGAKVLGGLAWPLIIIVWAAAKLASLFQ